MTKPLYTAIRSRIASNEFPQTPSLLPGEVGLKLAAGNLRYREADDLLYLDVYLAYAFPKPLWDSYRNLMWAIVIAAENTSTGQAGSVALKDPFKRYENDDEENFRGLVQSSDPAPSVIGEIACVPLKIETLPADQEPSLYLRATFREFVSNTLSVNVSELSVLGGA